MKDFFKNKTNIFLTIALSLIVGAGIFFGLMYHNSKNEIIVPDFSNKTKKDVETWCKSLEDNPCSFTIDYSDTIDKDYVIYQSIKANDVLSGNISFIISDGKLIEINLPEINDETTKSIIEDWALENNVNNITYVEEYSDEVLEGYAIKIEPNTGITLQTSIVVYISKGVDESIDANGIIHVDADKYIKLTEAEFIKKTKALGLTPSYVSKKDDYSSTIEKGSILWHGSGDYIKEEEIHYSLSLGKKDGDTTIVVKADEYVGKTEEELKTIISKLGTKGLTAHHGHSYYKDEYSDKYAKGVVIWHGSGTYEDGEQFNYVLSLGKKGDSSSIYVEVNQYVGKTEEQVIEAVKKLGKKGLTPHHGHSDYTDEYSDKYAKGVVIWHGSGTYDEEEQFNYVLSLGPAPKVEVVSKAGFSESEFKAYVTGLGLKLGNKTSEYSESVTAGSIISNQTGNLKVGTSVDYKVSLGKDTRVNVANYAGKSVSELETFLSSNGLVANKSTQYSSSVAEGIVISNTNGLLNAGSTVSYVVSLGVEPEKEEDVMPAPNYDYLQGGSFDDTKNNLASGPFKNFTNVTYTPEVSGTTGLSPGIIMSLKVNGVEVAKRDTYPLSTPIEIVICSKQTN